MHEEENILDRANEKLNCITLSIISFMCRRGEESCEETSLLAYVFHLIGVRKWNYPAESVG